MNNILELKKIAKQYQQARHNVVILKDINLQLKAGSIIAITGASGAGKSTLLHIAGLLDEYQSGEIIIDGKNIAAISDNEKAKLRLHKIGFIYQFHHLLAEFTARENVALPHTLAGHKENETLQKADQLLHDLGLKNRTYAIPGELSGGEQQRVAIARSLINSPKIILADEPTGNLDEDTAQEVFDLMLKLVRERNMSAIIITHNLNLAGQMDEIYKLENGTLIKQAKP